MSRILNVLGKPTLPVSEDVGQLVMQRLEAKMGELICANEALKVELTSKNNMIGQLANQIEALTLELQRLSPVASGN